MDILLLIHSVLRYALLIFLIIAIVKAFGGMNANKPYLDGDRKTALLALITAHIQFVIGLILYFTSDIVQGALANMGEAMKNSAVRFWAIEHVAMMLIAIILITIGYSKAKRALNTVRGHRLVLIFFILGLLLILAAVPWPFRDLGRDWL